MGRSRRWAGRRVGPKGGELLPAALQVLSIMASASLGHGAGLLRFLRLVGQLKVSERVRPGREAEVGAQAPAPRRLPSRSRRCAAWMCREGAGGDQADGWGSTRDPCTSRAPRRQLWPWPPLPRP